MAILSRSGWPSKRNLAKPFKMPRLNKHGQAIGMDNMKTGVDNVRRISNGSMGVLGGRQMVYVNNSSRAPLPDNADRKRAAAIACSTPPTISNAKRGKGARKTKRVARAHDKRDVVDIKGMNMGMLISFRRTLMTWMIYLECVGEKSDSVSKMIEEITGYMARNLDAKQWEDEMRKDADRRLQTPRMVKGGQKFLPPSDLQGKMKRARIALNLATRKRIERTSAPMIFKPEPQKTFYGSEVGTTW